MLTKKTVFPRKTDRLLHLRVLRGHCANDSVENYADLFTIGLRHDDIQEFNSKWDEILLSMTQIPPDDILESLYKLRIRESEKLKTVLELYNMEIHPARITSKELAPIHSAKSGTECLFYESENGCRIGGKVLLYTSPGCRTA